MRVCEVFIYSLCLLCSGCFWKIHKDATHYSQSETFKVLADFAINLFLPGSLVFSEITADSDGVTTLSLHRVSSHFSHYLKCLCANPFSIPRVLGPWTESEQVVFIDWEDFLA